MACRIRKGIFDRWIIVHGTNDALAWSGSRWVPQINGVPTGQIQVCNFGTKEKAEQYAADSNFTVVE